MIIIATARSIVVASTGVVPSAAVATATSAAAAISSTVRHGVIFTCGSDCSGALFVKGWNVEFEGVSLRMSQGVMYEC